MLLDLKKADKISDSTYKILYSSNGLCPRFYGLPKIREPGIPLRPIVSFVVIMREFCRLLLRILITLSKFLRICGFIRDKTLNACEELVSFDVVPLFTKIPVDLAVKVTEERLREDAPPNFRRKISFGLRTSLPVEDIIPLLSFWLKTTQFAYNVTYYQQVFGTAMGSPVSTVIANMVMEDMEQRA